MQLPVSADSAALPDAAWTPSASTKIPGTRPRAEIPTHLLDTVPPGSVVTPPRPGLARDTTA
jgi:hypothetical protein